MYDKDFDKLKFKVIIGNVYNALIYGNKLQIRYYEGKRIKTKNIFFKDQNTCIAFYKLLQNVYDHFLTYYIE